MKVKSLLIIITAVMLVISMTACCVFMGIQLDSKAGEIQKDFLSDFSASQAADLDGYLSQVKEKLATVSAMPAVKDFASGTQSAGSDVQKLFDALIASSGVSGAILYDNTGKIVIGSGVDTLASASEVCNTDAADNVPVIRTNAGDSNADYVITVKAPVAGSYSVALVFEQDYNKDSAGLRKVLSSSKRAISGATNSRNILFAVDPNGAVLTPTTFPGMITDKDVGATYSRCAGAVQSASATPTAVVDGDNIAYVTATSDKWVVVAYDTISSVGTFSTSATTSLIKTSILLFVILFTVLIVLIVLVTKPLYKIEDTLVKISRGNNEERIDIMSKNEYGDIARVFNNIVDDIIVSESRYRTIVEMSDNIIFEWNFINNEVIFSNNFNKKFSYRAPSDHFADSFLLKCKVHPEDNERYKSDLEKLAKGENFKHNEYRMKNIYGDYIWVLIRTATICDKEGKPVKSVGVIVDIDRAKKSENMLTARASFDALTGVYNRETIEGAINNEIELVAARKNEFAILFVDIDDFKFYNDQYSHATGDQVLRFTATTIRNAIGDNGMAGRYGGDEFIICLKNSDVNDPALLAEQILNTLKEGFDSDTGDHLTVNVSIGISIIKDDTKRVEEIIGMADDAMYKIKKNGKSNFGFLDEDQ